MVGESVVGIGMCQEENVWDKVIKVVVVSLAGRSFWCIWVGKISRIESKNQLYTSTKVSSWVSRLVSIGQGEINQQKIGKPSKATELV